MFSEGGMKIKVEDIYCIEGLSVEEKKRLLNSLETKLLELASFWEISYLPVDCRIRIIFLNKQEFRTELMQRGIINHKNDYAITSDRILILKYCFVENKCSINEYHKVIIHECVHMLQMYSTAVLPGKQVWLYESIACYMAGQDEACNVDSVEKPAWELVCSSFYSITNSYNWAYRIGKYIFDNNSHERILEISKDSDLAYDIGKKVWDNIL